MKLSAFTLTAATLITASAYAQLQSNEIEVADPFGSPGYYDPEERVVSPTTPIPSASQIPETHTVIKGDTLWDITGKYVGNPWDWPRIWSYNPEITNPHWIYPGGVLRLKVGTVESVATLLSGEQVKIKPSRHKDKSVYLRNQGYLDRNALAAAGIITGANEDHMLLSYNDAIYVQFNDPTFARAGQELAVFSEVPEDQRLDDEEGELVRVFGTVRIQDYNRRNKLSRAVITEALDPIERGYKVAPVQRRFVEVEPRTNRRAVRAHVVATLRPNNLNGDYGVVFVDVGREQGVEVGNRFLVVRRGDAWQQSLDDSPSKLGATADLPDQPEYPDEPIAELRVVDVQKSTAACLVTSSTRAVAMTDRAEMPKGY
ncbi:MAG: LysM peptidoglycan-binding domain-containing protein [Myxococcales bacterium]|nr:LysM peptidoglycan-binding domain-containing protein [Myxococcales bacterium]MCB9708304.1 LysM peptidoglycan-binding domain-containing protein [Myxococcales bacterium]